MIFTSVLLPAPFSPSSAWISLGLTSRSTRSLASVPGKRLTMPLSDRRGAEAAAVMTRQPRPAYRGTSDPPRPARGPASADRKNRHIRTSVIAALVPIRIRPPCRLVRPDSVRNFVGFIQPFLEHRAALRQGQMDEGNAAAEDGLAELAIDGVVVEADRGGIGPRVGVVDAVEPRPVDGPQAHGTGLAAGIEIAAREAEAAGRPAGFADRDDLGMGGRIVGRGHPVEALGDHGPGADDERSERAAEAGPHPD